jgi:predicted outer membrane protein
MRKVAALLISALPVMSCGRSSAGNRNAAASWSPQAFITSTIQTATADSDLAVLATQRGQLPETRELGAIIHRAHSEMATELAGIARRRNVPLPKGVAERQAALKDNLMMLQEETFDRAYALGMVQEANSMLQNFQAAERSNDDELRQFVRKHQPSVVEQQRVASRLLDRLGGSPFGLPP